MKKSRTVNTIYNFTTGIFGQIVNIVMQFIVRTVFIQTLGKSYLGINGLFSNILSMMSLAELGVGSAILFKLYKPLAADNRPRITALMNFYKKVYSAIGIVVLIIGLCLIPFLPNLVKDYGKLATLGINAVFIYLLYLMETVSSYLFFAYKSAIIKANQQEYIVNTVQFIFKTIFSVVQIIILLVFKNFELYVATLVINIIAQNFVISKIANRQYPYIQEKTSENIEKKEVKEIFKDCSSLVLYKMNSVVLSATDNIIISVFLGLEMVGLYSNYLIFYTTIKTILNRIFGSVAHSLGNLHASNKIDYEYKIFKSINLISAILGATAFVGIFCVADEFIGIWLGKDWIIVQPFAFLLGIEIYSLSMRLFFGRYRSAMGLFQQAKYRPVVGMIINLIVSLVLVQYWGIYGVVIGTIVADWSTLMWYDPVIIHKYGFKNRFPVKKYFLKNLMFIILTTLLGGVNYFICNNFIINNELISLILHAGICAIVVPVVFVIVFRKQEETQILVDTLKSIINRVKMKFKKKGLKE